MSAGASAAEQSAAPASDVFVARQPIFTRSKAVYGYELLYRSGRSQVYDGDHPGQATMSVIDNGLLVFGLEELTAGKKAFINFPRDLLVEDYASLLPHEKVVVEVLEDVEADDEVLAACTELRRRGYTIALDDFTHNSQSERLLDVADIVKVDFLSTSVEEQHRLARMLSGRGIRSLAEKVETPEALAHALEAGYEYFQGYFFSKPVILASRSIPQSKLSCLRLLREVNRADVDFDALERLVEREVGLSYKLLRYINSVAFGLRWPVTSLRQAMLFLGTKGVRQWANVIVLAGAVGRAPMQLIAMSVLRAKFCETIALSVGLKESAEELFLIGLFSLIDAILGRPLEEILPELSTSDGVNRTLLGGQSELSDIYQLALAYERADWNEVGRRSLACSIPEKNLPELYRQAVRWADQPID